MKFALVILMVFLSAPIVFSQSELDFSTPLLQNEEGFQIPFIDFAVRAPENNQEVALSLQLLLILAVLTLAPSIIVLLTSFLRISIVLDFVKRSLSLQQVPPSQVLMGVALFLTLFIMWPVINTIYTDAYRPFSEGEISLTEAYNRFESPIRVFMYRQMRGEGTNIELFMRIAGLAKPQNLSEVPTYVLIPSFILHELSVAFKIGILLFIPFIIIDMVVASTLMSMGMIMVPPVVISLPIKLALFILVDGWNLLIRQLIASFGGI